MLLTNPLPDDWDDLKEGDRLLLIIEDDAKFTKIVADFAHTKDFKVLLAGDGETGLHLVQSYLLNAIVLDLNLPSMDGWQVLDKLKQNPDTRHIPVHIMSVEEKSLAAYQQGAMDFLTKPVSQEDSDYLPKPVDQDRLVSMLQVWLYQ
jgi:DNA-binding response OmpR family regulator